MLLAKSNTWVVVLVVLTAGILGWVILPWLIAEQPTATIQPAQITSSTPSDKKLLAEWKNDIQPMLEHYCYDCHGDGMSKGDLDLDQYPDLASMRKNPKIWEHILIQVDYHLMPPPKKDQPEKAEREKLVTWIHHAIFPATLTDPGHLVMQRMNSIEYQNTLNDLLGIESSVLNILPPDDSSHSFDNNANALSISPAHIEKYLQAAEKALGKALVIGSMKPESRPFKGDDFRGDGRSYKGGVFFATRGSTHLKPKINVEGKYRLKVRASASQAGDEPAQMDISVGGKKLTHFKVQGKIGNEKVFSVDLDLAQGTNDIRLTFSNDFYDPEAADKNLRDRNLLIHGASLEGPLGVNREKPASHRRIFTPRKNGQSARAYAREVLGNFARRAFRRSVSDEEIGRYLTLAEKMGADDKSLESGVKSALSAMLVSPSFLFIAPGSSARGNNSKPQPISEHALASRLSYFLWSSMPDKELLALADTGKLRKNLDSQIARILKDDRSREMTRHFSGQWLQLRDLEAISPDRKRFPVFNRQLAKDMRTETEMLTSYILRENHSLLEFLDADFTFINESLARLYHIRNVDGEHFRRVALPSDRRRGILTHASILTITSQPDRTSPVLRGKFVLENILDITPPPPPPDLPELEEEHASGKKMTMREQLAMHRKKTACAGCHNLMDPVGLAFENYSGIGAWRDFDNGRAINSSGKLVTGEPLDGAESLRLIILNDKRDEFLRCLTVKLMTYALGRGVTRQDRLHIDKILSDLKKSDYNAHTLIKGVIHSVPFQQQRN